jgi:hypothetical protein
MWNISHLDNPTEHLSMDAMGFFVLWFSHLHIDS